MSDSTHKLSVLRIRVEMLSSELVSLKLKLKEPTGLSLATDSLISPCAEMVSSGPLMDKKSLTGLVLLMEISHKEMAGKLLTLLLSLPSTADTEEDFG
jgi:hypothetical protein